MKLTVIGSATPYPGQDNPCSGYLLEVCDRHVLFDCGAGVLMNLASIIDPRKLDAVVLSHLHGDHFSDMLVLKYGIDLALSTGIRSNPLTVYCPDNDLIAYKDSVLTSTLKPHHSFNLFGLEVTPIPADHPGSSFSVLISHNDNTLLYTGDTGPDSDIFKCSDVDVCICEATYAASALSQPIPGHLSGTQAGQLATKIACRHLLLTHISHFSDPAGVIAEAEAGFCGRLTVARPGLTIEIN